MFSHKTPQPPARHPTRSNLTRRGFLAQTAAGASLIILHPFSARAAGNQAHLRIMETTDLHVHVLSL